MSDYEKILLKNAKISLKKAEENVVEIKTTNDAAAAAAAASANVRYGNAKKMVIQAKKHVDNAKKIVENSDQINKIIDNDIDDDNIKELKKLYKQGIKLGVPEYDSPSVYGIEMNRNLTSVGRAKEIIDSFDEMVSISKNTNNPPLSYSVKKSLKKGAKKLSGFMPKSLVSRTPNMIRKQLEKLKYSERNNIDNQHSRLEEAFEECETNGCTGNTMDSIFDQLATLEGKKTAEELARNQNQSQLVSGMTNKILINRHRPVMKFKDRHQPSRKTPNVFRTHNGVLRAHSISNEKGARNNYNNSGSRYNVRVPGIQSTLGLPNVSKRNKKSKRKPRRTKST